MLSNYTLWGGCGGEYVSKGTVAPLTQLNNSLHTDKRLYAEDIRGNLVYAEIIQTTERELIRDAFKKIFREWEKLSQRTMTKMFIVSMSDD